jgi:hypothetical protein
MEKAPSGDVLKFVASVMGKKGGRAKTPAKIAAAKRNGKRGGRPKTALKLGMAA